MDMPQSPSATQETSPALKKRRLSRSSLPSSDVTQPSKKPKLEHPAFPPARFWDNLSKIELTRNAIRELDRRSVEKPRRRPQHIRKNKRAQPADWLLNQSSAVCEQIKQSAKAGGFDLTDLRGYPEPNLVSDMSSSHTNLDGRERASQSTSMSAPGAPAAAAEIATTNTNSTGAYDRAFQQHLIDHHILPEGYEYPDGSSWPDPENLDDIIHALSRKRASLSPSRSLDEDFRKFKRAERRAVKERDVVTKIIPTLEGDIKHDQCTSGHVLFTNLDHLTDGTLVSARPGIFHGARPEQLDEKIRQELGDHIIPSTQDEFPIAPNFFVEVKGQGGSAAVAKRQLSYDMALGTRGQQSLRTYKTAANSAFDGRAYTLGCTYHEGQLKIYTSHLIPPSEPFTTFGYATTLVNAWDLTRNAASFRGGVAAYRNARDLAQQRRDEVIEEANRSVHRVNLGPPN